MIACHCFVLVALKPGAGGDRQRPATQLDYYITRPASTVSVSSLYTGWLS